MFKTAVGRFRFIGLIEGISFIVLLLVAMPLKYWADLPMAVTIVGGLHGVLFVLYMLALANAWYSARWSFVRVLGAVIAAFLPFGTFVMDARIRSNP